MHLVFFGIGLQLNATMASYLICSTCINCLLPSIFFNSYFSYTSGNQKFNMIDIIVHHLSTTYPKITLFCSTFKPQTAGKFTSFIIMYLVEHDLEHVFQPVMIFQKVMLSVSEYLMKHQVVERYIGPKQIQWNLST